MQESSTPVATAGDGPRNLPEFWEMEAATRQTPIAWPTELATNVLKLTPTEAATCRVVTPPTSETVVGRGEVSEAAYRLALFAERGVLPWASAHYLAQQLQPHLSGWHPRSFRYARRGWQMLATLAELGWIEITISAEPTADDPLHFRRMPLTDRLRELAD